MAIPTKDELLVPYSANWTARITTGYATYAITQEQANDYVALQSAYVTAYNAMMNARGAGTRSRMLTNNRDLAKAAMLNNLRVLYGIVQMSPAVTEANKILLGVAQRNTKRKPVPAPTVRPAMTIASAIGRTITINVYDPTSQSKRAKLPGAVAAWVYTYVGATYPSDPSLWQFAGAATKYDYSITLPDTVASGSQVWITAAWATRRGDVGPVCMPISTYVQGGGANEQQLNLKIAA